MAATQEIMTHDEAKKIANAITAVQDTGFGRVEVVVHEGKIIEVRVTNVLKKNDLTN